MKRISNASSRLLIADKEKWNEGCTYIGTFFIFLTLGLIMYWGNLAVYTESYFRHRFGPDPEITEPWVSCLRMLGRSIGLLVAGYIAHFIGWRWTVAVGCFLMDSVMFFAVFSLKQSVMCLNLSLGLIGGIGAGITYILCLHHALSFQTKYQGLVSGFISSGIAVGAACLNQLITWYINPTNLTPDLFDGHQRYFTQPEILERVPSIFLVLGVVSLSCHVIGISLMRHTVEKKNEDQDISIKTNDVCEPKGSDEQSDSLENGRTSSKNLSEPSEKNEAYVMSDFSMRQILTSGTFYLLWFGVLSSEYSFMVFANFYKIYGETQIPDDQFLALLASINLFLYGPMQPLWGGLMDAYGVKFSLVLLYFVTSVSANFWYFTPMLSRWFYFVWTMILGFACSGFYPVFSVATLRLFGKEHFSKNYGMVMSSTIVINVVIPTAMQALVTSCGWFYLFLSVGCINAVGLVLSVLWLPQK